MYWSVCVREPQPGRGNFFLGPDTEYERNPSYRRVWGNLCRAGGSCFQGAINTRCHATTRRNFALSWEPRSSEFCCKGRSCRWKLEAENKEEQNNTPPRKKLGQKPPTSQALPGKSHVKNIKNKVYRKRRDAVNC